MRERLDRELLGEHLLAEQHLAGTQARRTLVPFDRARSWSEEGVPDDMKYIAVIESGLTNVVSPAGATGYWQFMKETALSYGLEVNGEVDERYHVEKSTEAAVQILEECLREVRQLGLGRCFVQPGPRRCGQATRSPEADNYFDLLLNDETARYVYRILAMKEILRDPERYGFHLRKKDLYAPYRTRAVEVNGAVTDLADYAIAQGTDYKTLKLLNPWLRDNTLDQPRGTHLCGTAPRSGFRCTVRASVDQPSDPLYTDVKKQDGRTTRYRLQVMSTSRCSVRVCTI